MQRARRLTVRFSGVVYPSLGYIHIQTCYCNAYLRAHHTTNPLVPHGVVLQIIQPFLVMVTHLLKAMVNEVQHGGELGKDDGLC